MYLRLASGRRVFFDVDGASLVTDGRLLKERPTIVLVHGSEVDHAFFKPWVEPLSRSAQLVYVDLIGHGRSDVGESPDWTVDAWADQIKDVCDALGLDQPVLLGSSLGGKIALALAVRHPGWAQGLIVANSILAGRPERRIEIFRQLGGEPAAAAAQADLDAPSAEAKAEYFRLCLPLTVRRPYSDDELARLRPVGDALMEALIKIGRAPDDLLDQVASITCPTLVMTGALDPAAPPDDAADLVEAIGANASLSVVPDAGLGVYRDQPGAFIARVETFLAGLEELSRT